jgi:hypothetical protein
MKEFVEIFVVKVNVRIAIKDIFRVASKLCINLALKAYAKMHKSMREIMI